VTSGPRGREPRAAGTDIRDNSFHGPVAMRTGSGPQINYFAAASPQRRERVLAGLPPEPPGFVGREAQIHELLEVLRPSNDARAVTVCAIGGLAGVGKSALALHTARQAVADGYFHDGLWLNLRGFDPQGAPVAPAAALPTLLRALGWDADLPTTLDEQFALYHTQLAGLARQRHRVLVLLDNVADAMQVDGLLPHDSTHRVIVTSRNSLVSLGARLVDLDVPDAREAIALMARALRNARPNDPRAADEQALAEIAAACGRLPLALQVAAALLQASPNRSVASLAGQLSDERARLEALRFPDSALRPGVRAALQLSYDRLPAPLARLVRLLGVEPGPDGEAAAVAALADLSVQQTEELLRELESTHLIMRDRYRRWSMHDLVPLYARELIEADPAEHAQARDRLLEYYRETTAAASKHLRALPGLPVPAEFTGRVAALEWLDANRANLIASGNLAAHVKRLDITLALSMELAGYLLSHRLFLDAIEVHTVAVAAARTVRDRRAEAVALTNLGGALWKARRFEEAVNAHHQATAIFRQTRDWRYEGTSINNLGLALLGLGKFDEAISAHEQACAHFRKTSDRHGEAQALNNLGIALQSVRRFEEAIDALQRAVTAYQEIGDRNGKALALNNLGHTLRQVRLFDHAITVNQQAIAIFQETGDRHGEAGAVLNFGDILQETRRFREAVDAHRRAVTIFQETNDRHGEANALNSFGLALRETRSFREAADAHRKAVTIYQETSDRHGEAQALNSLGAALQTTRRFEDAINAHQQAITLFRETRNQHGTAAVLNNLGIALKKVRRFEDAINAHQQAITLFRETGDQHGTAGALNNLGIALAKARRSEDAINTYQQAITLFRETGDRHSEAGVLINLGNALAKAHRYRQAFTAFRQASRAKLDLDSSSPH